MSWHIKKNLQQRLAGEEGAIVKEWGGKGTVALCYPNSYAIGMGNLALHALYRILNEAGDALCERAFLPDRRELTEHARTRTPLMSIESQRPLAEFDTVALTISFENDLLNLLPILDLARIPHRADERPAESPLIIAGGAMPTLNPRPLARIADAIALGEAEAFADDLIPLISSPLPKMERLEAMSKLPGVWVPRLVGSPDGIAPRFTPELDRWPTETIVHSPAAEFGAMHLIEIQRGCPFRCRFCATPAIYGRPRRRSLEAVIAMVDDGLSRRKKFGLIGAHILSHPQFEEIARAIHSRGATFSPSSVRASDIDDAKAKLLAQSGHRSIALGIEAGEERLRDAIGKELSDAQLFDSIGILAKNGITNLRLYMMIGLPGEGAGELDAIVALARRAREEIRAHAPKGARQTSVALTLSPFVPKPGTPFAGELFAGETALKNRIREIRAALGRERGIEVSADAPLSAAIEAYFASADEGCVEFLEEVKRDGTVKRHLPQGRMAARMIQGAHR